MESARQKRDQGLTRLVGDIRDRKHPYEPKEEKPIDWSSYTSAQVHEANDTLTLIRESVDTTREPPKGRSRKGRTKEYSAHDLAKTLLLQQYLGASNRVAQGYAQLFKEKLGLGRVPHYKAIERAYDDARVRKVLDDVFTLTQEPEKGHVEGLVVDGSALPRSAKANWESEKAGGNAKREHYDGGVAMLSLPHLLVTAHVPCAVGFESETPMLAPLLESTVAAHGPLGGAVVGADAAFLSRDNCTLIERHGGVPRIFPKRGVTLNPHGSKAWRRMLDAFLDDTQAWLRDYHGRSLAETHWGRHKHRNPRPLRRRLDQRRGTEKHARFVKDNLTRLGYLRRLGEVTIPWVDRWAL